MQQTSSVKALLTLYIDGKDVSSEDIILSLDDIDHLHSLSSKIDELYLISLYFFISKKKKNDKLEQLLNDVYRNCYQLKHDDICDELSYKKLVLSRALLGLSVKEEERPSFSHVNSLSHLEELSHLGVISFFYGIFMDQQEEIYEGKKIAHLLLSLINSEGEVDAFFMLDKGVYKKDSLRASLFILMSLYDGLTNSLKCRNILPSLDPYQGGLFQSLEVEQRLLCRLFEVAQSKVKSIPKGEEEIFEVEGLLQIQTEGFSFKSSQEDKVGLGSIGFEGKVVVPSFGPHVLPLGKSDLYGVKKPLATSGEVLDNQVTMWSRVASKEEYGLSWIHSKVMCEEKSAKVECFTWSEKNEEDLSLVFFLRGESIQVEEKVYHSGGLERAYVETSKLEVKVGGRVCQILLKVPLSVEIIPLAGQEFFWNSDFILSLPFVGNDVLAIEFVMD